MHDTTEGEERSMERGFWSIPKDVFARTELSLEARCLYGIFFTRRNGDNVAWPGQAYIAANLGVGERSVKRYVKELREAGLIDVERQGLHRTNRYRLTGQFGPSKGDTADPSHSKRTVVREQENTSGAKPPRKDADIFAVLDAFRTTGLNRMPMFGNKTQRRAADELVKAYGLDRALRLVAVAAHAAVASKTGEKFAPLAHTPTLIAAKLPQLEKWEATKMAETDQELSAEQVREIHQRRYAAGS